MIWKEQQWKRRDVAGCLVVAGRALTKIRLDVDTDDTTHTPRGYGRFITHTMRPSERTVWIPRSSENGLREK